MSFVFSHTEYCDMHFVYGFCDGNARAVVEEYQRCFPERRILSQCVFSCAHQTVHRISCLQSVCVQSEREAVPDINIRENILEMVQRSPKLSTHRIASCISVLRMQAWQSLHEEDLHPYHDQRVQPPELGDLPTQCMDLFN
jgi:hypothetical protein